MQTQKKIVSFATISPDLQLYEHYILGKRDQTALMAAASDKLWGGRFTESTNTLLEKFNSSIHYDQRMWKEDLHGSRAYAEALHKIGLLTKTEIDDIKRGLKMIHAEWEQNIFCIKPSDEDIHTANERRLKELIGQAALKLHTGRSRNDQVTTDMRLWLRSKVINLKMILCNIIKEFAKKAQEEIDILIPGYTHLQRAQPVRWSHWLLSHTWSLKADGDRLQQLHERINVMPLGSGAIAGNPFPIDRQFLANELGFQYLSPNSMYAVGDRDFVAEFLFWASLTAVHLSRLAEDLIMYTSHEFGFVVLSDAFSTGSSLMPQKKNPDSLELIRGQAGRIFGYCTGFMMVLKGLPSTYNKDLQEDKKSMFTVYDSIKIMLQIMEGVIKTLQIKKDICASTLTPDMLATDIAYYLVNKGLAFREAHHIAGEVVAKAEQKNVPLSTLSLTDLSSISKLFEADVIKLWSYEHSVEQYTASGGTSKINVQNQIEKVMEWINVNENTS